MNKSVKPFVTGIILIFFAICVGIGAAYVFQYCACSAAAKRIPENQITMPVRFFVYGSSPGTVSCRCGFYDRNGRELSVVERSWNGEELFLDFAEADFGSVRILFPLRLYTELSAGKSTELKRYYTIDGVCRIFADIGDDARLQRGYNRLCGFAVSAHNTQTIRLTAFETGRDCSVYTSSKGVITVVQD